MTIYEDEAYYALIGSEIRTHSILNTRGTMVEHIVLFKWKEGTSADTIKKVMGDRKTLTAS